MLTTFKNEPADCDEECYNNPFNQIDLSSFIKNNEKLINQFSIDDILKNTFDDIDFNIDDLFDQTTTSTSMTTTQKSLNHQTVSQNELKIENIFNKLVNNTNQVQNQNFIKNERTKSKKRKFNLIQKQQQIDKYYNNNEAFISNDSSSCSSSTTTTTTAAAQTISQTTFESLKCDYDSLSLAGENLILNKLNHVLSNEENLKKLSNSLKYALTRFKCKLNLRRLKRLKRLKLFDIDSYTNELIDSEKSRKEIANEEQQKQHLQVSTSNNDVEVIAVYRVLDRFNKLKKNNQFGYSLDLSFKIGLIEYRNDDIKCVVSPFTKKLLKPYIRRDFDSWPLRLRLHSEIHSKCVQSKLNDYLNLSTFERSSIDYVYLRPEHVFVINYLCKTNFWTGIDVTECLQYPDYTCVALYRKIIIGFAFIVPNSSIQEDYLSFIFVHPNWRQSGIAKYMLYRLANTNVKNELVLHVSVSNTQAVLLYQKFGFKIKEYIKHFYDKYYFDDKYDSINKDAFLMRLTR